MYKLRWGFGIFLGIALWGGPAVAIERPILFTVQPGFLKAANLRNLQDGWYPLMMMELHALRRSWLGYVVEAGVSRFDNLNDHRRTARFLATGVSFFRSFGKMRMEYRLTYGAFVSDKRYSTLFTHGAVCAIRSRESLHLQLGVRHIVPNDWISGTGLDEHYGSLMLSVGGGVAF